MIHDYKNVMLRRQAKPASRNLQWHWHGAIFFMIAALLVLFLVESQKSEASSAPAATTISVSPKTVAKLPITTDQPAWEMTSYTIELPPPSPSSNNISKQESSNELEWQTFIVKPGHNLAIICSRAGIKAGEVHAMMQLGNSVSSLQKLHPNEKILLKILPDGTLAALQYDIDQSERLLVTRNQNPQSDQPLFKAEIIKRPLEIRTTHASGEIEDSLYLAALKAGLSHQITGELASLFGWDIDFTQQVRRGDRFTVIYDDYYRDGEKLDDAKGLGSVLSLPRIVAAEFINDGKIFRALRYTDPAGKTDYYTPDGNNIRKTFMRNPIDARITSPFNLKRFHPILHKTHPHLGVDYGAPTGTPIRATGDGKVVFKGTKGGYGRMIIIQHGQRYSTVYGHMSKYAGNTARGRKIKQNQVVGYVGQSGLATGPHLHYEFRIDGVHRNPLTVKFPSVAPIPEKFKNNFKEKTRTQLAQLDTINRINLASDDSTIASSSL
ncbi:MAG: peptidoglycan DD-metalloendopeptidase family protein [Gammaproteobacteria bacterium]|nr:peptidoglycan DD-metalloendopeptidase family protein [Gammaproteobacteria bacterium]